MSGSPAHSPPAVPASTSGGRVFHTLDALRGIAAIGVVIFHMGGSFAPVSAAGGYLAVDLFFMMSGVVLSHAYEARFRAGMGTLEFMRVRLIRLYPLYLLGTLFAIAVAIASYIGRNSQGWEPSSLLQAAGLALLFLPSFAPEPVNQIFPLNIPSWSLFLELVVNFLFVLTWPLLRSSRLLAVAIASGIYLGLAVLQHGHIDHGTTVAGLGIGVVRTVFGFSVGVLIARHIRREHRAESNLGVLAIVAVFAVVIALAPEGGWRATRDAFCVLLLFPVLVWLATRIEPGAVLRRIATFLGLTSYGVYVLHSPLSAVLNSASQFLANRGIVMPGPWLGLLVLAGLLAGCWLVDRYYDAPLRRRLSRISWRLQPARAPS